MSSIPHFFRKEMTTLTNEELLFARTKPNAIIPSKRDDDAGYDIYACFDGRIYIEPNETVMIPTGLKCAFSPDYAMVLKERGSTGTKGMGQRCGVIDASYRGEIFVPITNHSNKTIILLGPGESETMHSDIIYYPYTKAICQAVMQYVPKLTVREVALEEIDALTTERGTGALGSSGK